MKKSYPKNLFVCPKILGLPLYSYSFRMGIGIRKKITPGLGLDA